MTIDELIAQLEAMKAKHGGDLPVTIHGPEGTDEVDDIDVWDVEITKRAVVLLR